VSRVSDTVVVLKKRPYREQDALLLLFSRAHGKLSAVARGARSPKGRLTAATEMLAVSKMDFFWGRSSLLTVTEAELVSLNGGVRRDLTRTGRAAMLADAVDELTSDHDAAPEVFDTLVEALDALGGDQSPTPVYLAALWRLMEAAGLKPDFSTCQQCGAPWTVPPWFWRGGTGPVDRACRAPGDAPLLPGALNWLRLTDRRQASAGLGSVVAAPAVYTALEQHSRDFLIYHLGRVPRAFRFWDEVAGIASRPGTPPSRGMTT
jgi:DNA repair protein RecO (recombination protein O)